MNLRWHTGLTLLLLGGVPSSGSAGQVSGTGLSETLPEPSAQREVWPERSPLRGVGGDLFDSRLPAVLHRDEASDTATGRRSPDMLPLTLVEIRADSGKIRLVGHTGAGRSLRGIFALPDGRSVLARSGEPVGAEGLAVRSMELRRVRGEPTAVRRARAVLVRELSGETLTLDAEVSSTQPVGFRALLRLLPGGETREVREGDRFEHGGRTFQVGSVTSPPGRVELGWSEQNGEARTAILVESPQRVAGRGEIGSR